jgi:hypothetical protein
MAIRKPDCPAFGCILYTVWAQTLKRQRAKFCFVYFCRSAQEKEKIALLPAGVSKSAAHTVINRVIVGYFLTNQVSNNQMALHFRSFLQPRSL